MPHARKLIELHQYFLYLTILLGFLAALSGGGLSFWFALLFAPLMVGAHFFQRAGKASPSHNRWWNILVVIVLVLSILQWVFDSLADPIRIGTRFVLVLTLVKLFSRTGERDELQLYALSFLTLAAASSFNEDFFFGIIFGLYVLTGTFGLALFHLMS